MRQALERTLAAIRDGETFEYLEEVIAPMLERELSTPAGALPRPDIVDPGRWGTGWRRDAVEAYAREYRDDLVARLRFVLENYVESEDGQFTFPDGDSWPCKRKEKT